METIVVTGAAGFIGAATSHKLLDMGYNVVGIDNLNTYYDPALKKARLERLQARHQAFSFQKIDISDKEALLALLNREKPAYVINLAAQAGVRYSVENPSAYADSNMVGFLNILEGCRALKEEGVFKHLVYASSSSVYGGNDHYPFKETDRVDDPRSLYAASKRANELMAHTYANLYRVPCSGLRFFTVYGPWGRPDMSPMLFAKNICEGKPITVFNEGDLWRDFTYIDDIVEGVTRVMNHIPRTEIPAEIYNIGNSEPVQLLAYIKTLEHTLKREAKLNLQPWPPTEVYKTYACTEKLATAVDYKPNTALADGLQHFADWFVDWYCTKK